VVHIINMTGRWTSTDALFNLMLPYEELGLIKCSQTEAELARSKQGSDAGNQVHEEGGGAPTSATQNNEQPAHDPTSCQEGCTCQQAPQEAIHEDNGEDNDEDFGITEDQISAVEASAQNVEMKLPAPDAQHGAPVNYITPDNLQAIYGGNKADMHPHFLVIDARRPDEFEESHIHGANNIHYTPPRLLSRTRRHVVLPDWVTKDTPIITYCTVGLRSGLLAFYLHRKGYNHIRILSGGYYKWVNEDRPIYRHPEELVHKVLIQHQLAGIMLRPEAKLSRQERKERKQQIKLKKKQEKKQQKNRGEKEEQQQDGDNNNNNDNTQHQHHCHHHAATEMY